MKTKKTTRRSPARAKLRRATVRLSEEHWSKLRKLEAERHEKGYSSFIAEALEVYFAGGAKPPFDWKKWGDEVLAIPAAFTKEDVAELRENVRRSRAGW